MSSSSCLSSSEVKGWNFRSAEVSWNWLQLVRCAYLQSHPGYFKRRFRIDFPECAGTENVYRNDSEYKCKDERGRVSEVKCSEVYGMCKMRRNRNRAYLEE